MQVKVEQSGDIAAVMNYLKENCPSASYSTYNVYWGRILDVWFADERDATMFILQWHTKIVRD